MRMTLALLMITMPAPVLAHPHVFVDASIEVVFDAQNRATGLRIGWTYDDLFSLMIAEDRGLDPDYDLVLTPDEVAQLAGFDMQWDAGFAGDTYVLLDAREMPLSGPSAFTAGYEGGRITSTHLRTFAEPIVIGAQPLMVQVYDPGFYTSYAIRGPAVLTGAKGCKAEVFVPDRATADAVYLSAIQEMAGSADVEADFPAVGAAYAEHVRITCAAP